MIGADSMTDKQFKAQIKLIRIIDNLLNVLHKNGLLTEISLESLLKEIESDISK